MRCISPLPAGFDRDGNITHSSKKHHPEMEGFSLPCRRCLPCRLNIAREKAVRCVHEAQMYEDNIFLTLTYDDQHLESTELIYSHFQSFMKDLRAHVGHSPESRIGVMVTGEYGELNKRPHWHAILFNYSPLDKKKLYETKLGEQVYSSEFLETLWGRGKIEFGSVNIDSAGYVARYAAKKLVHGKDQEHNFHPIHKTSSKNAIGKKWIEKYYEQTFAHGYVTIDGNKLPIPRYYVDWLKKHRFNAYLDYVTGTRERNIKLAIEKQRKEETDFLNFSLNGQGFLYPESRARVKLTVLQSKFKKLMEHLKL